MNFCWSVSQISNPIQSNSVRPQKVRILLSGTYSSQWFVSRSWWVHCQDRFSATCLATSRGFVSSTNTRSKSICFPFASFLEPCCGVAFVSEIVTRPVCCHEFRILMESRYLLVVALYCVRSSERRRLTRHKVAQRHRLSSLSSS